MLIRFLKKREKLEDLVYLEYKEGFDIWQFVPNSMFDTSNVIAVWSLVSQLVINIDAAYWTIHEYEWKS